MLRLISRSFILAGLILTFFGFYLVYLRNSPRILTFDSKPKVVSTSSKNAPVGLEIPSLKINLPIVAAIQKGSNWETTNIGVSYLSTTPAPGQTGNSVLYGHNWASLLRNLPEMKPGQSLFITMKNGERQEFRVEYTAIVDPSQTYIIDSTNDTRITLYTCIGFLDSKRFVVVAKPLI